MSAEITIRNLRLENKRLSKQIEELNSSLEKMKEINQAQWLLLQEATNDLGNMIRNQNGEGVTTND